MSETSRSLPSARTFYDEVGGAPTFARLVGRFYEGVRADPRLDYGRIRLWGSVAFLTASVSGGYIVAAATPAAVPTCLAGLALATTAAVRFAVPVAPRRPPEAKLPATGAIRLPPALWLVIAAAGWGKAKTVVQVAAIFFLIAFDPTPVWVDVLVYAAVGVTVVSGVDFFLSLRRSQRQRAASSHSRMEV